MVEVPASAATLPGTTRADESTCCNHGARVCPAQLIELRLQLVYTPLALHQLLPRSFRSRGGALRLLGIAGRGLGVLLVLLALRLSGRELRLQRCHLRLKGKLLLGRQPEGEDGTQNR